MRNFFSIEKTQISNQQFSRNMKKHISNIFIIVIVFIGIFLTFSCKRCATCTFDDAVFGQDTSDFCGSGNSYKDQLEQHEKNKWKCVEN